MNLLVATSASRADRHEERIASERTQAHHFRAGLVALVVVTTLGAALPASRAAALGGEAIAGRRAAVQAAQTQPGAGGAFDAAKFVFDSLVSGANSYKCRTEPQSDGCKFAGFGDMLRFFATEGQKQHQEILDALKNISLQIEQLQKTADQTRFEVGQGNWDALVRAINPGAIKRAMSTFLDVGTDCAGQKVPYTDMECRVELGDNTAEHPGALRLQIRDLSNQGKLDNLPGEVGGGATFTSGVLTQTQLPNALIRAAGKDHYFFNHADSERLQASVKYFVDLELSMITLGANYLRWANAAQPGSKAEAEREARIQAEIKTYSDAIQGAPQPGGTRVGGQLTTYAPLPNVAVDLRTRRVWGTLVRCNSPSTRAPQNCTSYEGYPITPGPGAPPVPFDCGPHCPDFTSEGWVSTTGANGGWQVPSADVLKSLLGPMPATVKPAAWLKQNADVTFAGPGDFDIWTANFNCAHFYDKSEGFDPPVTFQYCDTYGRTFLEMTTGNYPTSASKACQGGPCNAWYLLSRPGVETELAKWGVGTPS